MYVTFLLIFFDPPPLLGKKFGRWENYFNFNFLFTFFCFVEFSFLFFLYFLVFFLNKFSSYFSYFFILNIFFKQTTPPPPPVGVGKSFWLLGKL